MDDIWHIFIYSTFILLNSFPLNPIQLKNTNFFSKGIIIDPPQKLFCIYNSYFFFLILKDVSNSKLPLSIEKDTEKTKISNINGHFFP